MCGIAGKVGNNAGFQTSIESAINSISHRGPDEQGYFVAPGVELGIARLAIIDVKHGQQPKKVSSEDITIVFNGEIYNYQEIQKIVRDSGASLKGNGEAEALAELYKIKGTQFVDYLRGMFAIAIWDNRDKSLLLVRDRVGEKPLLYCETIQENFYFASEMRAFFAFGIKPDVNESQIRNYLTTGYLNTSETIVPMVKTLPPAHWLRLKNGKITITRYWDLPTYQETVITKVDATELLSVSLKDAVSSQLTSERPLGMYLSGGVDSTLVAAFASQSYSKKINTFSIGFENEEYDESGYARRVANYLGTNHSELIIKPDPELILKKIGRILDQPFGDSSIIPTFLLNQFARKEVVVALGGDGGDESMGGYDRYRAAPALQKLNILLKVGKPAVSLVNRYGYSKLNRRGKRLLDAAQPYPSVRDRYLELVSLIKFDELNSILHPNLRKINSVKNPLGDVWDRIDASNVSEKARILDIKTYLPNDLLFKSDTASMASGLEVRSPFLDYKYLEVAHLIPTKYKIDNNEGKHLLRQIAKTLVPPELVNRPKMGFAIPRAEWLRGPIKDMSYELLLGDKARGRGWFDTTTITEYWNAHQRGRDYDRILWPVLMFELWARNWVDQTV